jgi:hypothetical protein
MNPYPVTNRASSFTRLWPRIMPFLARDLSLNSALEISLKSPKLSYRFDGLWLSGRLFQIDEPLTRCPNLVWGLRLWWNWQTRYFEVVVGQPVQVQVLLSAPNFFRVLRQRRLLTALTNAGQDSSSRTCKPSNPIGAQGLAGHGDCCSRSVRARHSDGVVNNKNPPDFRLPGLSSKRLW